MPPANAAGERPLFVSLGAATRAPIGWIDFCSSYAGECETSPLEPRDIVLSSKAWKDLVRINTSVNDTVMLMQAGWPRQALLITVVRDKRGDGHAVLTVKTDKGEFVLDNQNPEILLWSQTGYRFVKRQSQADPNTWITLGEPRPAAATATSR